MDARFNDQSHTSGVFNFETVVCNMFGIEINDQSTVGLGHKVLGSAYAQGAGRAAKRLIDTTLITPQLSTVLKPESEGVIFHERFHYWQMLGSPVQQMRFTLLLECIRAQTASRNGRPEHIVGRAFQGVDQLTDPGYVNAMDRALKNYDAQISLFEMTDEMVQSVDMVPGDPRSNYCNVFFDGPFTHGRFSARLWCDSRVRRR
jgi:hypothetical protein